MWHAFIRPTQQCSTLHAPNAKHTLQHRPRSALLVLLLSSMPGYQLRWHSALHAQLFTLVLHTSTTPKKDTLRSTTAQNVLYNLRMQLLQQHIHCHWQMRRRLPCFA